MDEKNVTKISLSTFFLILAIIALIVMGVFIYKLNNEKTIETQKSANLQEQFNSLNGALSDLQEKINSISNTINTDSNQIKEQNNNDTTITKESGNEQKNEYSIAIDNIRKYLMDETWLKNNIYIQNDENSNGEDISDQVIGFVICKDNVRPSIIINVSSENARFTKTVLVTYINNNVKVEKITQGHIYHGVCSVDSAKNILHVSFMHMGDNQERLYKVKNGEVEFIGGYGELEYEKKYHIKETKDMNKDVSREDYEKYRKNLNIEQYNSDSYINLTKNNINEYIK